MEEKTKKGKGATLVIILLIIIILGLVGYIYYTSSIMPKDNKKVEEKVESTEEKEIISDELKNDLLSIIPEDYNRFTDYFIESIYGVDKVLSKDVNKELLYEMAYRTINPTTEKEVLNSETDHMWDCGDKEQFDKALKNMYNIEAEIVDEPQIDEVESLKIYPMKDKVCRGLQGAGSDTRFLISSTYDYKKKDENIELYQYVLFGDCVQEESICDGYIIYADAKYKNELDKIVTKDAFAGKNTIEYFNNFMSKYYNQAAKYKHTFKPNDDGGYYWYSTEKVE